MQLLFLIGSIFMAGSFSASDNDGSMISAFIGGCVFGVAIYLTLSG